MASSLALTVASQALAVAGPPTVYAALGDSYSSGQGSGNAIASSGSCNRTGAAYPLVWSPSVKPAAFVACADATIQSVQANQLAALNDETTLVTLTAGGNDLAWTGTLKTCATGGDSTCASSSRALLNVITSNLPARLDGLYKLIKTRAPHAKIIVLGYPRLFETGWWCGVTGLIYSSTERKLLNSVADSLDATIQARARAAGLIFVDVRSRFAGHGICSRSPYINDFLSLSTTGWFHPNSSGQAAYAGALRAAAPAGGSQPS